LSGVKGKDAKVAFRSKMLPMVPLPRGPHRQFTAWQFVFSLGSGGGTLQKAVMESQKHKLINAVTTLSYLQVSLILKRRELYRVHIKK